MREAFVNEVFIINYNKLDVTQNFIKNNELWKEIELKRKLEVEKAQRGFLLS